MMISLSKGAKCSALVVFTTFILTACSTVTPTYSVPPETAGGKPKAASVKNQKAGSFGAAHGESNAHNPNYNQ